MEGAGLRKMYMGEMKGCRRNYNRGDISGVESILRKFRSDFDAYTSCSEMLYVDSRKCTLDGSIISFD